MGAAGGAAAWTSSRTHGALHCCRLGRLLHACYVFLHLLGLVLVLQAERPAQRGQCDDSRKASDSDGGRVKAARRARPAAQPNATSPPSQPTHLSSTTLACKHKPGAAAIAVVAWVGWSLHPRYEPSASWLRRWPPCTATASRSHKWDATKGLGAFSRALTAALSTVFLDTLGGMANVAGLR